MIDWFSTIFSVLWIIGLGLEVAGLSLANYLANQQQRRFRKVLGTSPCSFMIDLGLILFCLGWTGLAVGWERIIWGILVLIFTGRTWYKRKKVIPEVNA